MRSSAKIGLYAVVLAGVVGGTGAWALTDKSVTVSVDGQSRSVHTRAGTVAGALKDAHLVVDLHDAVAPSPAAGIHDGSTVVVLRGRELRLNIDGAARDVWTTAATVDAALDELGYGTGKTISVSRSTRLPLTPTQITLLTPKHVTVVADHRAIALVTTVPTVAAAVTAAHVTMGKYDTVSVPLTSATSNGQVLTIKRVRYAVRTDAVKVPFATTQQTDKQRPAGTSTTVRDGKIGLSRQTFQFVYVDGKLVGKRMVHSVVVHKPVAQVVTVGTGKPEVDNDTGSDDKKSTSSDGHKAKSSNDKKAKSGGKKKSDSDGSSGSGSGGSSSEPTGGSPKAIAARLVSDHGWGDSQYSCLVKLWNRESGWSIHAHNGSGAYGIPQALPGSKMSSAGPNWKDNATTQIKWGLGYISSRYGTPCGAWGHSQSHGWY